MLVFCPVPGWAFPAATNAPSPNEEARAVHEVSGSNTETEIPSEDPGNFTLTQDWLMQGEETPLSAADPQESPDIISLSVQAFRVVLHRIFAAGNAVPEFTEIFHGNNTPASLDDSYDLRTVPDRERVVSANPYLRLGPTENYALLIQKLPPEITQGASADDIARFIWRAFAYEKDPHSDQDWIQSPEDLLTTRNGDCEDLTLFAHALFEINGLESFVVNLYDEHFAHSFLVFKEEGQYRILDQDKVLPFEAAAVEDLLTQYYPDWDKGVLMHPDAGGNTLKPLTVWENAG